MQRKPKRSQDNGYSTKGTQISSAYSFVILAILFAAPFHRSSKWLAARCLMASRFLVFFLFGVVLARPFFPHFSPVDSKTVPFAEVLSGLLRAAYWPLVFLFSSFSGLFWPGSFFPSFRIWIPKRCKGVHCVDIGESFPTHIYLQNLVSIQPRTSPVKFARSPCTDAKDSLTAQMQSAQSEPPALASVEICTVVARYS